MHEHVARAMYYLSIHLLFASLVATAVSLLALIRTASATTKYWMWVVTAFNFVVPAAAIADKVWAHSLTWAAPLGAIGGPVWDITQGTTAVTLALVWAAGASVMLIRLLCRIRKEQPEVQASAFLPRHPRTPDFRSDGIPVRFNYTTQVPAVRGILRPQILLPAGIDRVLSREEFNAVLRHEVVHARRRDNLIRLLYELALCGLWFHPLVWLAGAQMALYRELSCDESVIRLAHGQALVSALAKLALSERSLFLHATASSHLSYRLDRLAAPPPPEHRVANLLMGSLFVALLLAGTLGTVSHTACCFILKHRALVQVTPQPTCSRLAYNQIIT